ncbi:MAG: AtpZ/AtpI family protein [Chlorobi bacterium CHB2]|nr:AtpZ/AtpI family protein [Chlorobi bacterium CHB2]
MVQLEEYYNKMFPPWANVWRHSVRSLTLRPLLSRVLAICAAGVGWGGSPETVPKRFMPKQHQSGRSTMQQLSPDLGMGFQLAAAMAVFGGVGWWADSKYGTAPWLLVVGVVLGATGGLISMIRTSLRSQKP